MNDIIISKDNDLIPEGLPRCSLPKFSLWILILLLVLGWGSAGGFFDLLEGIEPDQYERLFRVCPVDHL